MAMLCNCRECPCAVVHLTSSRGLQCLSLLLRCQTREVRLQSLCRYGSCFCGGIKHQASLILFRPVLKFVASTLHASCANTRLALKSEVFRAREFCSNTGLVLKFVFSVAGTSCLYEKTVVARSWFSVFNLTVRARNVPVALFRFTSPFVHHGWFAVAP